MALTRSMGFAHLVQPIGFGGDPREDHLLRMLRGDSDVPWDRLRLVSRLRAPASPRRHLTVQMSLVYSVTACGLYSQGHNYAKSLYGD